MPPEPEVEAGLSSEDFSDDDDNEYLLGFPEDVKPAALLRHQFPSKIGGRPAWLDPVNLPTAQQLSCGATGRQLNFLLQVYAPLDVEPPPPKPKEEHNPYGDEDEEDDGIRKDVFHRTLYLFVTPQGDKITSSKAVRAFRCQLPRSNPYYDFKPPGPRDLLPRPLTDQVAQSKAKDPWGVLEVEAAMRSAAPAASSGSSAANQAASGPPAPAGAGQPGQAASELAGLTLGPGGTQQGDSRVRSCTGGKDLLILYPEKELMVEPEDREAEEENAAAQKLLAEYEARVSEEGELTEDELPAEILDQVEETHTLERKHFAMFQARTEAAPDQVIRYCFKPGARPLWPSPAHHPAPEDIPPCPHCRQPRVFEFQVMPQLLNTLDQDELSGASLDWSTLVVYSCPTSCYAGVEAARQQGSAYVEEFVWVQPAA